MKKTAERAKPGAVAVLLLASALAAICLPGCGTESNPGLEKALQEAGGVETGTTARWVRFDDEAEKASIVSCGEGQWASSASASSTIGVKFDEGKFAPRKAVGEPDVVANGIDSDAWGPLEENSGYEWLETGYRLPVHATSVRIREVNVPGSIAMVQLVDTDGAYHLKWKGRDRYSDNIQWMVLDFPATPYLVDGVRLTLDTTRVANWKLIDAVQLVGYEDVRR